MLYLYHVIIENSFCAGQSDVWIDEPTPRGILVYSIITPLVSLFGICGNFISLIVLQRREFKASIYTYLCVLAATDLLNSVILFIAGLCRGVLWWIPGWAEYEAIISLPLGGALSSLAVIATVAVALDRVVYLWNPTRRVRPAFCRPKIARRVMFVGSIISILFNVPYCFMFEWTSSGELKTTAFFDSQYYAIHNWIKFAVFGMIPSILLIFGNGFLIYSLNQCYKLQEKWKKNGTSNRKARDQRLLTTTLVAIVFFFMIGEFPTHLASRKTAVTILFSGDDEKADASRGLEVFRQIATLLNATNIAVNFVIYCVFCPLFRKSLKRMLGRTKKIKTELQLNVFILNDSSTDGRSWFPLEQLLLGIMALTEKNPGGFPQYAP